MKRLLLIPWLCVACAAPSPSAEEPLQDVDVDPAGDDAGPNSATGMEGQPVPLPPLQPDGGFELPTGPFKTEARVVWLTRYGYRNRAELEALIDRAAYAGFNVVLFQVASDGDAYYRSKRVPWARRLSGTLGKDPGWDPLQVAIDRAHARGIELHAFWNVYATWPSLGAVCTPQQGQPNACALPPAVPAGSPEHVMRVHPEWLAVTSAGTTSDGEYFWLSPGNPAVTEFLLGNVAEILANYKIDGFHLDRIRYPGVAYSHDAASLAAYNALPPPRPTYADWQREQINSMVGQINAMLKRSQPRAVLTASVWGIYKVLPGCHTSEGNAQFYQDSVEWLRRGAIDAIMPMIYWNLGTGCTDFKKHLDFFQENKGRGGVIAGTRALDQGQPQVNNLRTRIEYTRTAKALGSCVFASDILDLAPVVPNGDGGYRADPSHRSGWDIFPGAGGLYADPALPPWSTKWDGGT